MSYLHQELLYEGEGFGHPEIIASFHHLHPDSPKHSPNPDTTNMLHRRPQLEEIVNTEAPPAVPTEAQREAVSLEQEARISINFGHNRQSSKDFNVSIITDPILRQIKTPKNWLRDPLKHELESSPSYRLAKSYHDWPAKIAGWAPRSGAAKDVNIKDSWGMTALHHAARNGDTQAVERLLENEADGGIADVRGVTPLFLAAYHGHLKCVAMLANPADFGIRHLEGWTALYAGADDPEIMRYLFYLCGASPDYPPGGAGKNREKVLHLSCRWGPVKCIQQLLEAPADPNVQDRNGITPLHLAAAWADKATVEMLVDAGASLYAIDDKGTTPVHVAAAYNPSVEVLEYLVGLGHITEQASEIHGPLLTAYLSNEERRSFDPRMAQLLLSKGSSEGINQTGGRYHSALHAACACSTELEAVKWLLENGADPNLEGDDETDSVVHKTALHAAIDSHRRKGDSDGKHESRVEDKVALLLEHGANPELVGDKEHPTAMQRAVANEMFAVVYLLKEGQRIP